MGLQRDVNEDALYLDDLLGVYLVCDGMGGHASGQVASEISVRTVASGKSAASAELTTGISAPLAPGVTPRTA